MESRTQHLNLSGLDSNFPASFVRPLLGVILGLLTAGSSLAQVSPAEIKDPALRAAEQQYLPQLQSLQHSIGEMQFPLPFILTRYVGVDPARQPSLDSRGLEFVYFQDRMLLKTSGFYTAAFSSDQLTPNERAARIFQEVIVPILRLIAAELPAGAGYDDIGFEIAYHVHTPSRNSDFEGREILVVVLDRSDAIAYLSQSGNEDRQAILNRSGIYLDGKPFALALGQRDPVNLEALGKSSFAETGAPTSTTSPASRFFKSNPRLLPVASSIPPRASPAGTATPAIVAPAESAAESKLVPSQADAERLQTQFQSQIDALLKEDGAKFHIVDYAPASFALYHKQLVLQITLRNPLAFDRITTSIYKRAAQSLDLFLAPQLKSLVPKLPSALPVDALDFSILNSLGNAQDSSEALEFICPLKSIRSFIEDEISTQDLINQSVVLVNGVRIRLDLELAE